LAKATECCEPAASNMKIDLSNLESDSIEIYIDGKLAAHVILGEVAQIEDLKKEVTQARVGNALVRVVNAYVKEFVKFQDLDRVGRGVVDGMMEKTVPHPTENVPPILPDFGREYEAGYGFGKFLKGIGQYF
jgi:hypothetical protein